MFYILHTACILIAVNFSGFLITSLWTGVIAPLLIFVLCNMVLTNSLVDSEQRHWCPLISFVTSSSSIILKVSQSIHLIMRRYIYYGSYTAVHRLMCACIYMY